MQNYLLDYLRAHPCVDCSEADPIVLELDHRDGEVKHFEIGKARKGGYSLATVITEIAKCDIRCANATVGAPTRPLVASIAADLPPALRRCPPTTSRRDSCPE